MNSGPILYGILLVSGMTLGEARKQYNCDSIDPPMITSIQFFAGGTRTRIGIFFPNLESRKLLHKRTSSGMVFEHVGKRNYRAVVFVLKAEPCLSEPMT